MKDDKAIAGGLARLLADSYAVYLKTHGYHWNVRGRDFASLHTLFMVRAGFEESGMSVDGKTARFGAGLVVFVCFLVAAIEGYDIQAFGVASPKLVRELGLGPAQQGWGAAAAMVLSDMGMAPWTATLRRTAT